MVMLSDIRESKISTRRLRRLDSITKQEVERVIEYAEKNIVSHSTLEAMIAGQARPVGDNKLHACIIRPFRIVYSIEEQAIGLCRHLSVSISGTTSVPNQSSLNGLVKLFGFEGDVTDCYVWVEELPHSISAVNLVQPLEWDRETSTLT